MSTFVVLSGTIEPESIKVAQVGTPAKKVCNFRVATNPGWYSVAAWEKVADSVPPEGSFVIVQGRLQTRSYDKDGQKHYATEIVASTIEQVGAPAAEAGGFDD